MMNSKEWFEETYRTPGDNPWTSRDPPQELVELVESGKINPCKTLDIGCGEGYYSLYLASNGFEVTGVDFSERAISLSKAHAQEAGVTCRFLVMEWKELEEMKETFDFILDWRFLHELLEEEQRGRYVQMVKQLLSRGGCYLSASFSDETPLWGTGTFRTTDVGILLSFASLAEMEQLFSTHFKILERKVIVVTRQRFSRPGEERAILNYFLMKQKRDS